MSQIKQMSVLKNDLRLPVVNIPFDYEGPPLISWLQLNELPNLKLRIFFGTRLS